VRVLDAEWKLLRCPTEDCLPNLTPPRLRWYLNNDARFIASRIRKRNVKIAVRFNLEDNYAACESEPFIFDPRAL
jgi:hypothetical protein